MKSFVVILISAIAFTLINSGHASTLLTNRFVVSSLERDGHSLHAVFETTYNDTAIPYVIHVWRPMEKDHEIIGIIGSSDVPDKMWPAFQVNGGGDFEALPNSSYGPLLNYVPFDSADKVDWLANTNRSDSGSFTYQANGPEHSFLMGQYEISNDEYIYFLNDAEANQDNARGANMYFSPYGYVVFNSNWVHATKPSSNDMFDPAASLEFPITYETNNPVGSRYSVKSGYENIPVAGVSWYGAVKYCNWLTIQEGLGEAQRAYSEGQNPQDWRPVVATNWPEFSEQERGDWVAAFGGYRLPMIDTNGWGPSLYNEYYKAWAWDGVDNSIYGFGRDSLAANAANYYGSGDPYGNGLTPKGYYDGTVRSGYQTKGNDNCYGIYDLVGNVGEWVSEAHDLAHIRHYQGGCFLHTAQQLNPAITNTIAAFVTVDFVGFRVARSIPVTNMPLSVYPSGDYTTQLAPLFFQSYGGDGSYAWSLSNTNIGMFETTSGASVGYLPITGNTTQFVFCTDGVSVVTTRLFQIKVQGPAIP